MPNLTASESARIAGKRSWEVARPVKLLASARGGATVTERYGDSHMLRLALRIKKYACEGGEIPPRRQDSNGRGKCPACGKKRVAVTSGNLTHRHVRADAPPMLLIIKPTNESVEEECDPVSAGRVKGATL